MTHVRRTPDPRGRATVTHVVGGLEYGGLEKLVVAFAERGDPERFCLRIVTLAEGGVLRARLAELGVEVHVLGRGGLLARAQRLRRCLLEKPTQILHTHNPSPHILGALARSGGRVAALVHTKHGTNFNVGWRGRVLNHWAARRTDAVVAVSHNAADAALNLEWVPADKVSVIWNGVDLGPEPVPRILSSRAICVARLNRVKDHETLLRALRLIADRRPGVELELVGDGPQAGRIAGLRDELGLARHLTLSGACSDVRARLDRADVFVMTSLSEGISLTVLEAMAAGLPTVVTAVGGSPEIVVDGVTGTLVPPRDPAAVARAVQAILDAPTRAAEMGRAGRQRVAEHFNIQRMVRDYEALYERLLSRPVGRGA